MYSMFFFFKTVYLFVCLFVCLLIRSYLQIWGDHSMRSIVLPWYPGGHILVKIQDQHRYLQIWAWGGIPKEKKKHKAKNTMTATLFKGVARNRRKRRITITKKKKKMPSPPMTPSTPWLKDRNASPHNFRVFDKLTKTRDKHINLQGTEKREITKRFGYYMCWLKRS